MKVLLLLFYFTYFLNADTVEVIADKFLADEKKMISEFTGNVSITKNQDKLMANKVVLTFNKKREPLEYTATGDAKINIMLGDKLYFGSANKMVYNPSKSEYMLIDNAFLHEKVTNKKIYGDTIYVNQKTGRYEVKSDGDKPVKFVFKVKDK